MLYVRDVGYIFLMWLLTKVILVSPFWLRSNCLGFLVVVRLLLVTALAFFLRPVGRSLARGACDFPEGTFVAWRFAVALALIGVTLRARRWFFHFCGSDIFFSHKWVDMTDLCSILTYCDIYP